MNFTGFLFVLIGHFLSGRGTLAIFNIKLKPLITFLVSMILGVALPHENLSWFATKVTDASLSPAAVVPPKKGKPMDYKKFVETVHGFTKDWGTWGQSYVKGFML